jgi:hypothetical protein
MRLYADSGDRASALQTKALSPFIPLCLLAMDVTIDRGSAAGYALCVTPV